MNELKFNSAVCTSIEQSQRLLDLGLKPETADMAWSCVTKEGLTQWVMTLNTPKNEPNIDTPAWSLHRLMDIYLSNFGNTSFIFRNGQNPYDLLISDIEQMIDDGFFNKEYLEQ